MQKPTAGAPRRRRPRTRPTHATATSDQPVSDRALARALAGHRPWPGRARPSAALASSSQAGLRPFSSAERTLPIARRHDRGGRLAARRLLPTVPRGADRAPPRARARGTPRSRSTAASTADGRTGTAPQRTATPSYGGHRPRRASVVPPGRHPRPPSPPSPAAEQATHRPRQRPRRRHAAHGLRARRPRSPTART